VVGDVVLLRPRPALKLWVFDVVDQLRTRRNVERENTKKKMKRIKR